MTLGAPDFEARWGDAVDALYRARPAQFVGLRNALRTRLAKAGLEAAALEIAALRRPSLSVWVVNALWWTESTSFAQLLDAGATLRAEAAAGALVVDGLPSPAIERRRSALGVMMDAARRLLQSEGGAGSKPLLRRVAVTLEACAAIGARALALGRLRTDLDPPGFGVMLGGAAATPWVPDAPPQVRDEQAERHLRSARAELERCEVDAQGSAAELARAQAGCARAKAVLADAVARVAVAETSLTEAATTAEHSQVLLRRAQAAVAEAIERLGASAGRGHSTGEGR